MQYDKGLYPLLLLKILEEYSDKDKPISMLEIQSLMESVSGHRPVRNTVTANFERLETIGFNIVKVKTDRIRFYLKNRMLSYGEIKSLCDLIHSSFFISSTDSEKLINHLLSMLPKKERASYRKHIHNSNRKKIAEDTKFFDHYAILSEACDRHFALKVRYRAGQILNESKPKDDYKSYVLFPYAMIANDGRMYVMARAKGKPDLFPFRVDRFKSIKRIDEPFPIEKTVEYIDYYEKYDRLYMRSGNQISAKFLCDKRMLSVVCDRVGHNARYYSITNDQDEFCLIVTATEESILLFAQQYMDGVTLLEPQHLKIQFENRCKEALKRSRAHA